MSKAGNDWVDVNERLPDGDNRVLCVNSAGYMTCVTAIFKNERMPNAGWMGEDETPEGMDCPISNITHWMPLPKAPNHD